jgi:hypothetical protein
MMSLALALGVQAADPARPRSSWTRAEMEKLSEIEGRAYAVYPRRRDTPLRYLNLSDGEVREIQRLARQQALTELVNISPVVTGCPCEEGANCTEQAHLVGNHQSRSIGLQLSRVKDRWSVSVVQKWWLEYAGLKAREKNMTFEEFMHARQKLLLEFPQCAADGAEPASTTTAATK